MLALIMHIEKEDRIRREKAASHASLDRLQADCGAFDKKAKAFQRKLNRMLCKMNARKA